MAPLKPRVAIGAAKSETDIFKMTKVIRDCLFYNSSCPARWLLLGWAMGSCPGRNWAIRNGPMSDQDTATRIVLIQVLTICIISIISLHSLPGL